MLRLTEWGVHFPENVRIHMGMSTVFHGALMATITPDAAEALHAQGLRPYSQYLYWDRERNVAIWRIGTLTDDAHEAIVMPLMNKSALLLRQKRFEVSLDKPAIVKENSFENLADTFIAGGTSPKGATWDMLTPASFKQEGRYVIMPDMTLLYGNLIRRWNAFSSKARLDDLELSQKLAEQCRLMRYRLESRTFPLEGTQVYGFDGRMRYGFFGFDMMRRVQGMLTAFAAFSGIGIKTALGMGAVKTEVTF